MSAPSSAATWLGRLLLGLGALVLTLVGAEAFLARFAHLTGGTDLRGLTTPDPRYGYRFLPQARKDLYGLLHDYVTPVTINRYGFRSPAYPPERRADTVRIALLGDSEVFGLGVTEPAMLDRQLEARRSGGRPWEVLNFGMPGVGTLAQEQLLQHEVLRWCPDWVLVVVNENDLEDNRLYGQAVAAKPPKKASWKALMRSNLFQVFKYKVLPRLPAGLVPRSAEPGHIPALLARWYANERLDTDFFLMTGSLRRMQQVCEAHGVRLALTLAPPRLLVDLQAQRLMAKTTAADLLRQAAADADRPERMLRHFARTSGLDYIETVAAFRQVQAAHPAPLYYPNDGHLNAAGTRELARLLAEALYSGGLTNGATPAPRP